MGFMGIDKMKKNFIIVINLLCEFFIIVIMEMEKFEREIICIYFVF